MQAMSNISGSSSFSVGKIVNERLQQNKQRVQRNRMTADFIRNLPEGITYMEPSESQNKDTEDLIYENLDDEAKEGDIVRVGDFLINIEKVTKAQIIGMRKFLPSEEYRLLKNRKSARLCRRKRKEERGEMQITIDELKIENQVLKDRLEEMR